MAVLDTNVDNPDVEEVLDKVEQGGEGTQELRQKLVRLEQRVSNLEQEIDILLHSYSIYD